MLKYLLFTFMLLLASPAQEAYAQNRQCQGKTTAGTRCKLEALKNSKYCKYHQIQDPNVKQCEGTTEKGERCKLAAEKNSKYCEIHGQGKKCEATTTDGTRCKNPAEKGSKYCHMHKPVKNQCKATTASGNRCSRQATTQGYCTQHYKKHKQGKI